MYAKRALSIYNHFFNLSQMLSSHHDKGIKPASSDLCGVRNPMASSVQRFESDDSKGFISNIVKDIKVIEGSGGIGTIFLFTFFSGKGCIFFLLGI